MINIKTEDLKKLAKKYKKNYKDLEDTVHDMESDGIYVDIIEVRDMILNNDI